MYLLSSTCNDGYVIAGDWTILSMGTHNVHCSQTFIFLATTSFHATDAEYLILAVYRTLQLLFKTFFSEGNHSDASRNV
jgi:hypothetical protein